MKRAPQMHLAQTEWVCCSDQQNEPFQNQQIVTQQTHSWLLKATCVFFSSKDQLVLLTNVEIK